jgi:DNA-binding SARP family transcriptional activator
MIHCRTLGPIDITLDGAAPPPGLLWRKNLALLVYLARSPKRTRTREHLTGLLWGDKPEGAARHSLREAIRVLRRAAGEDGLTTPQEQVRLAEGMVRLDLEEFEALEREGDWGGAAALIGGEFLEGFSVPDASGFEDWLGAERLTWRGRCVAALANHAEALLARGNAQEAGHAATRALALDGGSNAAVCAALRALALAGDRTGALARYEEFLRRLEEAGATPDTETASLAARVRAERVWRLSDEVPTDAQHGAELRRAPLVGREGELARIVETFTTCARTRHAAATIIEADAGLGKSRLAEEVMARARLAGAATAAVRAVEADLDHPGSGALGLARGGLLEAGGTPAASPTALAAFAAEVPEWRDRFGAPRSEAIPMGRALAQVLPAIAEEQPLAVLVDDAQWVDRDSLLALVAALRDAASLPLFVLLAAQPHPRRTELDDLRSRLGRDVPGSTLVLKPLDGAALRRLAAWAIPEYGEPELDRLARRVAVDSAGLPLLAVELLHAVALGLDLGTITGAWPEPYKTLDQTLPAELPEAVVGAIRVGFRRLTQRAQQVLAAAAVLDDRVSVTRLEHATSLDAQQVITALDELEWQRWLAADPRGYSFVARIVREVVGRDMLTEGQRQRVLESD